MWWPKNGEITLIASTNENHPIFTQWKGIEIKNTLVRG